MGNDRDEQTRGSTATAELDTEALVPEGDQAADRAAGQGETLLQDPKSAGETACHDETAAAPPSETVAHGETLAARGAAPSAICELPERDASRYQRGREIARGGMGRIVAAHDRELGRAIALKEVISPNPALKRRFEREIRITARLQHPAIISVHEAGRWSGGDAFYVMKHVEGEALDKAIARKSTLAERLQLLPHVLSVADALAYAHAERVIHRDLKPANVLVGAYGETVVIDWGLAKELSTSEREEPAPENEGGGGGNSAGEGLTIAGEAMGTPAYMPPEQAKGELVDERADVYALGAMLYQLLAGTRPFAGETSPRETLQALLSGPPDPISRAAPEAPPDLLAIVDKAMAREPSDRYPTAKELADDLRRFETGQLVGAHEYSTWQLIRRWGARHRGSVAVGAAAALVLAVVSAVGIQRIRSERSHAERQQRIAETNRAEVEDLLDFMLTDLRAKLEPIGRLELLDLVAQKAASYYASRSSKEETPAQALKRSFALSNVGDVLVAQGNLEGAREQYFAALAIQQRLVDREPTRAEWQRALSGSHTDTGRVLEAEGDLNGALAAYRESLAIDERLAAREPGNADWQRELSVSHDRIGDTLMELGDLDGALEAYRSSLALREKLTTEQPSNTRWQHDLSVIHDRIGDVLVARGDLGGALEQYQAALATKQRLADTDPSHARWQRGLSVSHSKVGDVLAARGDLEGALDHSRASLAIFEKLAARDPSNAGWQDDVSIGHAKLGRLLRARGDVDGALEHFRAALTIDENLVAEAPDHAGWQHSLAVSHNEVGRILAERGDLEGALEHYQAALMIAEKLSVQDADNARWQSALSIGHSRVGSILHKQQKPAAALEHHRKALAILQKLGAKDPRNVELQRSLSINHQRISEALLAHGDPTGALEQARASVAILEKLTTKDPSNAGWQRDLSIAHERVGSVLEAQGDMAGARAQYRTALAIAEKLAVEDPNNALWQADVAEVRSTIEGCCRDAGTR